MKLKEARKIGIEYCEENNCNYTYISFDNTEEFYLTPCENKQTVFLIGKNGSLKVYRATEYAVDFHRELRRRKNFRKKNSKKMVAEIANHDLFNQDLAD